MIERGGSLALSPNFIGSKDPHAWKIPARKGGIRLTDEHTAVPLGRGPERRDLSRSLWEEAAELAAGGVKRALMFLRVAIMNQRSAFVIDHIEENVFYRFVS